MPRDIGYGCGKARDIRYNSVATRDIRYKTPPDIRYKTSRDKRCNLCYTSVICVLHRVI